MLYKYFIIIVRAGMTFEVLHLVLVKEDSTTVSLAMGPGTILSRVVEVVLYVALATSQALMLKNLKVHVVVLSDGQHSLSS